MPPRRRGPRGVLTGAIGFAAGIAVAAYVTTPSRPPHVEANAPRAASVAAVAAAPAPPPHTTSSDARVTDTSAIVKTAAGGHPAERSGADDGRVDAAESATASAPAEARTAAAGTAEAGTDEFWVQVGAFKFRENAVRMRARLEGEGRSVVLRPGRPDAQPWVLAVGPYADEDSAHDAELALADDGVSGFVVRGDQ
jgi:cell division septation protein DedD